MPWSTICSYLYTVQDDRPMIETGIFIASGTILVMLAMMGLARIIHQDTGLPLNSFKVELTTVIIITLLTLSLLAAVPALPVM